MFKKILALGVLLCLVSFVYAQEEKITITTYYPSPYGSYRELRSQRMAIGDGYIQANQHCWPDDATCSPPDIDANADLVVEGNVGIGTANPRINSTGGHVLDVAGPVAVTNDANIGSTDFTTSNWIDAGGGVIGWNKTSGAGEMSFVAISGGGSDGGFAFYDKNNQLVRILKNGNVGIGTTNPLRGLHVADRGTSDDSQSKLRVGNGVPGQEATVDIVANDGSRIFQAWDDNDLTTPRFIIGRTGNVAIGTTDPQGNRLRIVGGTTKTEGGLIIETRTTNPGSPPAGQMWLCVDAGADCQ